MEPPEIQTRIAGCLTENELRIISGQARTLQKRLKMIDELDSDYQVSEIELEMLEEWEDMFPDQSTFETRLRRDGVTREKCKKAVSTHRLEDHESLPAWTEDLKELAAMIDDASVAMIDGLHPSEHLSHPDSHRPFGPLTAAVATYARGQLPPTVINTFGENAIEGMVEWFRDRMETRYLRLLYVEFKTYVAYHDEDLAFADPQEFDDPPTEYYEKFVNLLFDGGFAYLCVEYPVFARLLVEQIRQWVDHLEEFCGRFNADRGALSKWLCGHETLGNVTKLVPLADDTHADGRAVMQLVFESGQSVVYKPRSVDAGQAFYEVLQNLEPYLLVPEFVSPSFLSRDEYGWMEWIEQQHPSDEAAIERYYERVGAIICLSYFMNIKDCQTENYLFSGEHPIILDVETALHPYLDLSRRINADIAPVFDESVLLSLLLPFRVDSENGSRSRPDIPRAICGIATSDEQIVIEGITAANITALNTDVMRVEHNPPLVDRSDSVPTVSGESYLPKTYVDTIAKGFRSTYTTIIRLRDEGRLSDEIGFPDIFKSVENRFIFRDTTSYIQMMNAICSAECLSNGARFGIELERLAVPLCTSEKESPPWKLYDAECEALKLLDPPRFTSSVDDYAITRDGAEIGVCVDKTGLEIFQERIKSATLDDMERQVEFIYGSLEDPKEPTTLSRSHYMSNGSKTRLQTEAISDMQLRNEAKNLYETVHKCAVFDKRGTAHWASVSLSTETSDITITPVGADLYNGRCGIALFGCALYQKTGQSKFKQFAINTLRPVREQIRVGNSTGAFANHGGTMGLGSILYGLTACGTILGDDSLVTDAHRAADLISPEMINRDITYEVTRGSAGTILGLLALYDRTGREDLVRTAEACGNHLLNSRTKIDNETRVWKTIEGEPPLAGFAHGNGGIAYALTRLSKASDIHSYRNAALEALRFESQLFVPAQNNWPDRRKTADITYPNRWCHGLTGIGLSRLGIAKYITDDVISRDFDRALEGTSTALSQYDELCCGNTGRIEFLLEAQKHRTSKQIQTREFISDMVERKRNRGWYQFAAGTQQITNPTFFSGVSGIGYTLLRATSSGALPCVLLWE